MSSWLGSSDFGCQEKTLPGQQDGGCVMHLVGLQVQRGHERADPGGKADSGPNHMCLLNSSLLWVAQYGRGDAKGPGDKG